MTKTRNRPRRKALEVAVAAAIAVCTALGCARPAKPKRGGPEAETVAGEAPGRDKAPATTAVGKEPDVTGRIDYSTLELKGNGHTQDSFSLAVQAAARLLGKDPELGTIYCLSTNAFSPMIDLGEDCTAWWHVQGWLGDKAMRTVAGRLGLRAERLSMPKSTQSPDDSPDVLKRKALENRKARAKVLRQAMERGAIVITDGGWRVKGEGGFVPWCWWGIITRADEDGTILGACLKASPGRAEGDRGRPLDYVGGCWALSDGEQTLSEHEADLQMLKDAVRRIRGDAEPFARTKHSAYGLRAMDAWIRQMNQVPFCRPCHESAPDRVWTCAINNGQTTIAGAKAAASYLRRQVPTFPETARPHIEMAAELYEHIVELLHRAVGGDGGQHYRDVIGDLDKQKAHAEGVLMPIKQDLARAADEIEKALVAMGEPTFRYGFRYDPMAFVKNDKSLQGAKIRARILGRPLEGDGELLDAKKKELISGQLDDGLLSNDPRHRVQFTAAKLIRYAELGGSREHPVIKKAIEAIMREGSDEDPDALGIYETRALTLLGATDCPKVPDGLERCMTRKAEWSDFNEGCPWTPIEHLITLWHGRDLADTLPAVTETLESIHSKMNDAGRLSYKDPWGFVRMAGVVDHLMAATIARKLIPMVLRAQSPNGGWGDQSYFVFRMLTTHDLLEPLKGLPPLPPDWRVVRAIPAPRGKLFSMTWDGQRLWVYDKEQNEAVAVSPRDGKELKRVSLPAGGIFGIGWWDDALAVTQMEPKKLLQVHPETGTVTREISLDRMDEVQAVTQVGGSLWIVDGLNWVAYVVDPAQPEKAGWLVPAGCTAWGGDMTADAEGVWHFARDKTGIIKSGLDVQPVRWGEKAAGRNATARLLDWGEKPFGGSTAGIAWDGENLWVLDNSRDRICVIEKAGYSKRRADGVVAEADALEFLERHCDLKGKWSEWDTDYVPRRYAAETALRIADQYGDRSELGARALLVAGRAYSGACEHVNAVVGHRNPLGDDGWDQAIAMYERVTDEHPGTDYARQAQWFIAMCHGVWVRCGCCRPAQGKRDWPAAVQRYRKLYETSVDPGGKCDALRRIAEIQCMVRGADRGARNADVGVDDIPDWREGLKTLRRMFDEFPGDVPRSPYVTSRACGVMDGKAEVDYFLMRFSLKPLLEHAQAPEEAIQIRNEFVELAPDMESIKHSSLLLLEQALRRLGDDTKADEIESRLGICGTWLVCGTFSGNEGRAPDIPEALAGYPDNEMLSELGTEYAPETDFLAGALAFEKVYPAVSRAGSKGNAAWYPVSSVRPMDLWEPMGVFYALTHVEVHESQTAQLRIGASGHVRAWLNKERVGLPDTIIDWPVMDHRIAPIRLEAGANRLFIKFTPYDGFDGWVRITDEEGNALAGITYSVPEVSPKNKLNSSFVKLGKEDLPPRFLAIAPTDTAPAIDGKLDDAVWKREPDIDGLMPNDGRGQVSATTVAWLSWDDTNLYLAVRCDEPNLDGLRLNAKNRDDSVWNDDSLELFLDMKLNRKTYYQLIVSAANVVYDGYERKADWNADLASATGREEGAWTLEMAIPWKTLGQEGPPRGKKIGFNLLRSRIQAGPEYQQWAPTLGSAHRPEFFGTVEFLP